MDHKLQKAIANSPLSDEDKAHWRDLLPKMDDEHKEKLLNTLIVKTQVSKAVRLISKALDIIEDAEAEAEEEVKEERQSEKDQLMQELKEIKEDEEDILANEANLKKMQEENQKKMEGLRTELSQLSQKVHGAPPPSYG